MADVEMSRAAVRDASVIVEAYDLNVSQIEKRLEPDSSGFRYAIFVFLAGLFSWNHRIRGPDDCTDLSKGQGGITDI